MNIDSFNIRVYGLIINSEGNILISDEFRMNTRMTKFPGGGLEFGEGTIDCIKREIKEELNLKVIDAKHYYTTDFFQEAMYFKNMQLISIYYLLKTEKRINLNISSKPYDFDNIEGAQSFRWVHINTLKVEDISFPIDKIVAQKIKQDYSLGIL